MTRPLLLSVLLASTLLIACEHEPSSVPVDLPKADKPKGSVSLPPAPSAQDFIVKEKNDDGTLRVLGMIEYKDKHMNKEVVVKGWLAKVSADCDAKKAEKKGLKCPEPHLLIKDSEDADEAVLIVGFDNEYMKKAKFEQGATHTFKGTYRTMAQGFTATESGIVLVSAVDDKPLVEEDPKKKKRRR